MTEQQDNLELAQEIETMVTDRLKLASDQDEELAILKAFSAVAIFSYADRTSLVTAADWLR